MFTSLQEKAVKKEAKFISDPIIINYPMLIK